jgi:glycosyltransferase involved in cell wall biosynthesis
MVERPLVSIVVRTCPGRGTLLERALASINAQSYRPVQVVLAEDGGDSAQAFVARLRATSDIDIKYLPLGKVGRCAAGNAAMEAADGLFLNFLDDDDELLPHHLSALAPELLARKSIAAVYAASFVSASDLVSTDPLVIEEHRRELFGWEAFDLRALWVSNRFPIQAVLFRSQLFHELGGLAEELDALEDWDLWLRYSAKQDFAFIEAVTSRFRVPFSKRILEERADIHNAHVGSVRVRQEALAKSLRNTPYRRRIEYAYRMSRRQIERRGVGAPGFGLPAAPSGLTAI